MREAHAAIGQEIRKNLRDLEGTLPALEDHQRHLAQALRFADDLIRTRSRPQDLEVFRLRVLDSSGAVALHRDLARQLVEVYKQIMAPASR